MQAAAAAFGALSDPVRVRIVSTLAAATADSPTDPLVGFATLRRRVGVDDSGRFRYHLNQLRGTFVRRTEEGYRLTTTGREVAGLLETGVFGDSPTVRPTPLDEPCPRCETALRARYADGLLRVACPNDHEVFAWTLPPSAVTDRSIEAAVTVAVDRFRTTVSETAAGVCPACHATVTPRAVETPAGARLTATCASCSSHLDCRLASVLTADPAFAVFCRDHDRQPRQVRHWQVVIERLDDPGEPVVTADAADPAAPSDPAGVPVTTRPADDPPADDAVFARFAVAFDRERLVATVGPTGRVLAADVSEIG